ncbi:MAG: DUF6616 family protein [Oceanococcus sp.]
MYTFIEICKAKNSWLNLSSEERAAFLSPVTEAMANLEKSGAEILSWGYNDPTTPNRAKYDFFAIFQFPNKSLALEYEKLFSKSAWYEYFEQINLGGQSENFNETLKRLVSF